MICKVGTFQGRDDRKRSQIGGNCSTNYDSCQSLENNLWARGEKDIMHQYTLEFLERNGGNKSSYKIKN
jgi:hypothetical protein